MDWEGEEKGGGEEKRARECPPMLCPPGLFGPFSSSSFFPPEVFYVPMRVPVRVVDDDL